MSSLGIFFGTKSINIVETKGKGIVNSIQIDRSALAANDFEEKVPDELKLVALLKDELRKAKIEAGEATLALSGKDLIIRTFEMPLLPGSEIKNAVAFEAKKYIPFKIEDLVLDYQLKVDKANRRNLVLFSGIKKETLNKYLSILNQLNIKINAIEYSAFSVLRFVKLAGIRQKGVTCVVGIDFHEEDETNFTVLEDDFPLFSRDITVKAAAQESANPQAESAMALEKLKTELRVSLDFYNRKFPNKNISKVYFIVNRDYRYDLEVFAKDMGLTAQFIDATKYINRPVGFSLSLIKSYGCSLLKIVKTDLKMDILAAREKMRQPVKEAYGGDELVSSLFTGLRIEPLAVILSVFICAGTFVFGFYKALPVRKELETIISTRPKLAQVDANATYEELNAKTSEFNEKINTLNNLIKNQMYLTDILNVLPRLIPEGAWLTNLSFRSSNNSELSLQGLAYLVDSDKELKLVNELFSNLKRDATFNRYFREINIVSIGHERFKDKTATNFSISCRNN